MNEYLVAGKSITVNVCRSGPNSKRTFSQNIASTTLVQLPLHFRSRSITHPAGLMQIAAECIALQSMHNLNRLRKAPDLPDTPFNNGDYLCLAHLNSQAG